VNAAIEQMTGKALPAEVLSGAWQNLTFTNDPIGASLEKSAADATSLGLLPGTELDGIYDLRLLNEVLAEKGLAAIAVP